MISSVTIKTDTKERSATHALNTNAVAADISGVSRKVTYDNTWRSHFCSLIGNINLNRRTKNTHKMGMGNFKESAGMLKNTL